MFEKHRTSDGTRPERKRKVGMPHRGCHEVTGGEPGTKKGAEAPSLYPRAESNRNRQNRNLKFYPLNYKGMYIDAKIDKFIYKR